MTRPRRPGAIGIGLALAALSLRAPAASAQATMTTISAAEVEAILTQLDLKYTQRCGASWWVTIGSGQAVLTVETTDPAVALLRGSFGKGTASVRQLNEWNKGHRFARAYIDDEGSVVLASDLSFVVGGVTVEIIKNWILLYRSSLKSLALSLAE